MKSVKKTEVRHKRVPLGLSKFMSDLPIAEVRNKKMKSAIKSVVTEAMALNTRGVKRPLPCRRLRSQGLIDARDLYDLFILPIFLYRL